MKRASPRLVLAVVLTLCTACGDDEGGLDADAAVAAVDASTTDAAPPLPPLVVSVSPAPHSIGASVDTPVSFSFADPGGATFEPEDFAIFGRWSGAVTSFTTDIEEDGGRVTVRPDAAFSAGEQVTVIVFDGGRSFTWQFWTAAAPASLVFTPQTPQTTRSDPKESSRAYGGVGSDLNGDRFLDIAIVNEDTADVRVFLNTADGSSTFAPFGEPTFPVNQRASPNEPQDFNGDGHVDLCVANIDAGSISVLLGNGDGTFRPQQEIQVGAAPRGIAPVDFDGDGDFDIVATSSETGAIERLENTGGVFARLTPLPAPVPAPWALTAVDMDTDGQLDLVIGERDTGTIAVMRGRGDGTFALVSTQDSAGAPWMLVAGDVDGDGDADVAVANSALDNGAILLNDGAGVLGAAAVSPVSGFPLASDLGDLDGDGDLDWMLSSFDGSDWSLLLNNGAGQFALDRTFTAPRAGSCALMLDTDNDGDLDLALIDELADELLIVLNE